MKCNNKQTVVTGHQPIVSGHQPIISGHQPIISGHQPIVSTVYSHTVDSTKPPSKHTTAESQHSNSCVGTCPIHHPMEYILPNVDCNKFCICSNGHPMILSCPPGLHYCPELKVCTNPIEAGCAAKKQPSHSRRFSNFEEPRPHVPVYRQILDYFK